MENDFQNWAHTKAHERLLKRDSWFNASQLELRNLQAPWWCWCWWPIDHTLGNTCLEETKAYFSPILASSLPHTLEDDLSPTPRLVKMGPAFLDLSSPVSIPYLTKHSDCSESGLVTHQSPHGCWKRDILSFTSRSQILWTAWFWSYTYLFHSQLERDCLKLKESGEGEGRGGEGREGMKKKEGRQRRKIWQCYLKPWIQSCIKTSWHNGLCWWVQKPPSHVFWT